MISAILDTNVLLQSLIGSPRSASVQVLEAYYDGRFRLVSSSAVLDEAFEVLMVPRIRVLHGLSDDEILEFIASLIIDSNVFPDIEGISHEHARDVADTKFLALAQTSQADFLVTNDRRDLLRVKNYGVTQIVTPTTFLRQLG